MATVSAGTAANNTLTGMIVSRAMPEADVASIIALIKGDSGPSAAPIGAGYLMPGSWSHTGVLYVPGRGILVAQPGDYVAVDPTSGWPILISAAAVSGGGFVV